MKLIELACRKALQRKLTECLMDWFFLEAPLKTCAVGCSSAQLCAGKSAARNTVKCLSNSYAGSGLVAVSSEAWFEEDKQRHSCTKTSGSR